MSKADELAKLVAARDAGDLTAEEFDEAKREILSAPAFSLEDRAAEEEPVDSRRLRNRRRAYAIAILIILALVAWVVVGLAGLSPARFTLQVRSVTASSAETVTLNVVWSNQGDRPGVGTCTISTAVHDKSGRLLEDELTTVTTNGTVSAGGHQDATVQVIVNASDAKLVKRHDVTVTACQ